MIELGGREVKVMIESGGQEVKVMIESGGQMGLKLRG